VFSQPVLLALVGAGLKRDDAYRIVQRDAARALEEQVTFRVVLENDPDVVAALGNSLRSTLDDSFDMSRALRHAGRTFAALEEIAT
jgi:adenylosuccinate lyase